MERGFNRHFFSRAAFIPGLFLVIHSGYMHGGVEYKYQEYLIQNEIRHAGNELFFCTDN